MPRSSLLNALMRIAADVDRAERPARPVGWGPKIERRAALRGAASLAGMALLPRLPALAAAEARVAIVGAGLAGLTAAYELSKAGLKPDVYEGSTRLGGRCYSIRDKFPGQIAEHGGEFINPDHHAIKHLARALHLQLDDTAAGEKKCPELWSFDGVYTCAKAKTDYEFALPGGSGPVSEHRRQKLLLVQGPPDRCLLARAPPRRYEPRRLGAQLCAWRPGQQARAVDRERNVRRMRGQYNAGERPLADNPIPAEPQNRLRSLLQFLRRTISYPWRQRPDSAPFERKARKAGIAVQTGTALAAVKSKDGKVQLSLTRKVVDDVYDRVILALPFTILRQLDIARAGFRPLKRQAIEQLGMGASTKFQLRFKNRHAWHDRHCNGEIRLNSNLFQTTWDVTRAQPGNPGILCFWSGGRQAEQAGALHPEELANRCLAEAEKLLPGLTGLWTREMTRDAWRTNPWSLGSYAYYPVGYATRYLGIEEEPEGHCFFAGEHTAKPFLSGYLNAAVETGQRAAKQVLGSLKIPLNAQPNYKCDDRRLPERVGCP